jgi:uncharacterized membrane protein (DUF485 family)
MEESKMIAIEQSAAYQELVTKRTKYNRTMAIIMMAVYFIFIALIAFNPSLLATKVSEGSVLSVGILGGFITIVFAFILTGIYVKRANSEFDSLTNQIKEANA